MYDGTFNLYEYIMLSLKEKAFSLAGVGTNTGNGSPSGLQNVGKLNTRKENKSLYQINITLWANELMLVSLREIVTNID